MPVVSGCIGFRTFRDRRLENFTPVYGVGSTTAAAHVRVRDSTYWNAAVEFSGKNEKLRANVNKKKKKNPAIYPYSETNVPETENRRTNKKKTPDLGLQPEMNRRERC